MSKPLPHDLIMQIQNHTGFPWWNGQAYAEYVGYPQRITVYEVAMRSALSDMSQVIEALRSEKLFAHSDNLRAISDRLAKKLGGIL